MLCLKPYKDVHRAALLALKLRPEQEHWTHTPAELLPEIAGNPQRQGVTVLLDSVPIGFFVLGNDERVEWYAGQPDPAAVTLNGLSLDLSAQGQGLGRAVMAQLPALTKRLFPAARRVLLCVHQTNAGAIHVYQQAGFEILRERQGKRGLLWVMGWELP